MNRHGLRFLECGRARVTQLTTFNSPLWATSSGPAKDLSLQLSQVTHRANSAQAGDDIDRLYVVIQYPLKLGPF